MRTGAGVFAALKNRQVDTKDIVINRQGEWLVDGFVRTPDRALTGVDAVFIALHGVYGEDGTVQRLLDRFQIPYTGSGAYASSVAMNKLLTKSQLKGAGVKMAPHFRVTRDSTDLRRVSHSITDLFGPDYVIKPVNGGSSIGVEIASGEAELIKSLGKVLDHCEEAIVEKRIHGKEATVGILEGFRDQSFYRLPVVEIVPPEHTKFFDYEVKYNGQTDEICPGRFTKEEKSQMEEAAETIHRKLDLKQYSRSDFIVAPDGVYFLEVNTLPGLTAGSLLPVALEAVGCPYEDFVLHLVNDTLTKN